MGATSEGILNAGAPGWSGWKRWISRANRYRTVTVMGALCLLVAGTALIGPWAAPFDPEYSDGAAALKGPSAQHLFGTDELGRDLLSRVLFGLRYSFFVGISVTAIVIAAGVILGVSAGYRSRSVLDLVIMRIIDTLLAIPLLVLAMVVVGSLGSSTVNVILAISVGLTPSVVRVVRSGVISEASRDYVLAAEVVGASRVRVMVRHILPNVVPLVLILASATFGFAILVESSLSFLGLGPPPNVATLGRLLAVGGQRYWAIAPWMALAPGIVLAVVVLVVNLLGDALRDALDPRTRI